MALTIASSGNFINVTFDGATAWDCTSSSGLTKDATAGLKVKSIQIIPAATADVFTIRTDSATGTMIYKGKAADAYEHFIKYFHTDRLLKLYVKGNEVTTGVVMIIEI